jgi:hypothetical protein
MDPPDNHTYDFMSHPLVETIGGDQASSRRERLAERGLLGHCRRDAAMNFGPYMIVGIKPGSTMISDPILEQLAGMQQPPQPKSEDWVMTFDEHICGGSASDGR